MKTDLVRFCAAIGLLGLSVLSVGCGGEPRYNVVVVTFDTTRADHLASYGNSQIRTPATDALAAEGVLFEHAYSPVPITLPSHSSVMTGKVPFAHGVRDNGLFKLNDDQTTMAEILRDAGYLTAAAVGAFPLIAEMGLAQGFDLYDDHLTSAYEDFYGDRIFPKERLFFDERPAGRVNEAVLPWLENNYDEPFFLWVHYFDPHLPHEPPAPFDQLYSHELYDGEIAYSDESLGTLVGHLKRLGVYDETLIVFTSDHGEGRGEHEESTHSMLVYNSTLHVPLIMKPPSGTLSPAQIGTRVDSNVGTIDVLPTVLEVIGLEPLRDIQGESLLPYARGERSNNARRGIYAETLSPRISRNWGEQRALIQGDYKYIHGPRSELYDLSEDPREVNNLIESEPEVSLGMEQRLRDYLSDHAVGGIDSSVVVDEDTARRLQALGYLQSAGQTVGPLDEKLSREGAAPQDHVQTISEYSQAKNLMFVGRFPEAKQILLELLENDAENIHYLELLFSVELRLGKPESALEILANIEAVSTGYPAKEDTLESAGQVLLSQNRVAEALEKLVQSQEIRQTASGQYRLAKIYERLGQTDLERERLDTALSLDSTFVPARIDLAIAYARRGDLVSAEPHFRQAIEDSPYHHRAHFNYGAFLVQGGKTELALESFERAVDIRPTYAEAHYALVETHYRLGNLEAAQLSFDLMRAALPRSQATRMAAALLAGGAQ